MDSGTDWRKDIWEQNHDMNEAWKKSSADSYTRKYNPEFAIPTPKYTWKLELHPDTFWMVEDHRVPNWFHRKMQELCFGLRWIKIS